jgi:hypothetical protein
VSGRARHALSVAAALVIVGAGAGPSPAGAEALAAVAAPVRVPAWIQDVTLDGFVSGSYSHNFGVPASRTNTLRVFDIDDDSFTLDVAELVAQKAAAQPRETGFRVDLALGSSIPRVSSALGLFRTATSAEDVDLQQAYATYVAPAGSGLKLDFGKFVTPNGYEVIDGYDGWNDNATRSLLFGYAIPFTHVGVRAGYTFSPRVSGLLLLVNGWDVVRDDNRAKTIGAQLAFMPVAPLSIVMNAMTGAERANSEGDRRTLLDVVAVWKPRPALAFGLNGDVGREDGAVVAGETARWDGIAAYARLAGHGGLALSVRGETFEDLDGSRTGVAQRLRELTLTPEARVSSHMVVRGDLRFDHSDHSVFEHRDGTSVSQTTALIGVLYSF